MNPIEMSPDTGPAAAWHALAAALQVRHDAIMRDLAPAMAASEDLSQVTSERMRSPMMRYLDHVPYLMNHLMLAENGEDMRALLPSIQDRIGMCYALLPALRRQCADHAALGPEQKKRLAHQLNLFEIALGEMEAGTRETLSPKTRVEAGKIIRYAPTRAPFQRPDTTPVALNDPRVWDARAQEIRHGWDDIRPMLDFAERRLRGTSDADAIAALCDLVPNLQMSLQGFLRKPILGGLPLLRHYESTTDRVFTDSARALDHALPPCDLRSEMHAKLDTLKLAVRDVYLLSSHQQEHPETSRYR